MQQQPIVRSLGMMSGTSLDGSIDVAVLLTDGDAQVERVGGSTYTYEDPTGPRPFHHLMRAVELAFRQVQGRDDRVAASFDNAIAAHFATQFGDDAASARRHAESFWKSLGLALPWRIDALIQLSTDHHAHAIRHLQQTAPRVSAGVELIGYHGQTVFHAPMQHVTVQLGDAQRLADSMRIPVVFDFRSNDVAHGGQGAPLAPLYHRALASASKRLPVCLLNLGGCANVTALGPNGDIVAFDTGPANGLLDRFVHLRTGQPLDRDGALAARGSINESLLQSLLERSIAPRQGKSFFDLPPPKSLDVRDFQLLEEFQTVDIADGCATLTAFTAEAVIRGLPFITQALKTVPTTWIICGGGARNPILLRELEIRLSRSLNQPVAIVSADDTGWSSSFMEAEIFAYLAVRSLRGLPISTPQTTGVNQPLTGGTLFSPR